jgi:radical SAM protein with 4Fe4S-binding SPASM domain
MGDCACHSQDLAWRGEWLAFAFLELTPVCNNRCMGCSNPFADRRVKAPLSGAQWIGLIRHLHPYLEWVKLTGGEPTLHPDFEQIAAFLNDVGLPFRLLTNGRWTHPDRMVNFLRRLSSVESLLISVHGPDAPSHEGFSGVQGSFDQAVRNARLAAEGGLKVALSTVITRHNWDRLEDMVSLARDLGADHVSFSRYIGPPMSGLEAAPGQVGQAMRRVEGMITDGEPVRLGTPLPQCVTSIEMTPCLAGEAFVTVDPWGRVRPCNHAPLHLGNLRRQSLVEILDSEATRQWRGMLPQECLGCALGVSCRGGCRAEAMLRPAETYPLPRSAVKFPALAEVNASFSLV